MKVKLDNIDKNPHYGVFNASIVRISDYKLTLKDIFSSYEFDIEFNLSEDFDYTKANKSIYINQYGNIGYGDEELLFDNFKKHKYWQARHGEVKLFKFLKALHNPNIFDSNFTLKKNDNYISNSDQFKELFLSDYEYTPTIGGIIYLNHNYEECILDKFIPGNKVSILRNSKGNFKNLNDIHMKEIINMFNSNNQPEGQYNFDYIIGLNDEGTLE